ncbi:MAG: hypothetical protein ACXWLR_06925, partial [Myxococcales bacterium]
MQSGRWIALALAVACTRAASVPGAPLPKGIGEETERALQAIELARAPSAEARSLLGSKEAPVRVRAALAVGRIGDRDAIPGLAALLDDAEAGETAAWALGRIEGGNDALLRCLERRCPATRAAARALSGPAAFQHPAVEALVAALSGQAAPEAAASLGVLARNKDARFPPVAYEALAFAALHRTDARAGAMYALSRLPPLKGASTGQQEALRD